jgi:aspartate kinase
VASHIKVLKFGGTSVAGVAAFERAIQIVRANEGSPLVVVVSAMRGVTDALIESFHAATSHNAAIALAKLEEQFERHVQVAHSLCSGDAKCVIEHARGEIIELLELAAAGETTDLWVQDAIASYGERLCAQLFTDMLEQHDVRASHVDARSCILTDDQHGSANPLTQAVTARTRAELEPLLERGRVPVLGGFMGATAEGVTTTLGRGSSDYSATLIGGALQAAEIQIWTDVDGVQTADPCLVRAIRTVPVISYEEAGQLAVLGARVMHPKMIKPVVANKIPIRIRDSKTPERDGTLICAASEPPKGVVKAIAHHFNSEHAIVGCVGDGLSDGSRNAASVRRVLNEIDSAVTWRSTSPSNLVAIVNRDGCSRSSAACTSESSSRTTCDSQRRR